MATALRRAPPPALLWLLALAGGAAAAASVVLAQTSDHASDPDIQGTLSAWVTITYVLAGLVAWERRPQSRFGPLMVTAGFTLFLSSLSSANAAVPYTIGFAFDIVPAVVFLHVFLAFPGGRLESTF